MASSRDAPTGRRVRAIPRPRGTRLGCRSHPRGRLGAARAASTRAAEASILVARAARASVGGKTARACGRTWAHGATARGSRRRIAEPPARTTVEGDAVRSRRHRHGRRTGSCPRARPHPQRRQASQHPGEHHDRPRLADRLRHCLAPAARARGSRDGRGDRRNTRVHGAGTDRPDEPRRRCPQPTSIRPGGHLLRAADGRPALPASEPMEWVHCHIARKPVAARRAGRAHSRGRSPRS